MDYLVNESTFTRTDYDPGTARVLLSRLANETYGVIEFGTRCRWLDNIISQINMGSDAFMICLDVDDIIKNGEYVVDEFFAVVNTLVNKILIIKCLMHNLHFSDAGRFLSIIDTGGVPNDVLIPLFHYASELDNNVIGIFRSVIDTRFVADDTVVPVYTLTDEINQVITVDVCAKYQMYVDIRKLYIRIIDIRDTSLLYKYSKYAGRNFSDEWLLQVFSNIRGYEQYIPSPHVARLFPGIVIPTRDPGIGHKIDELTTLLSNDERWGPLPIDTRLKILEYTFSVVYPSWKRDMGIYHDYDGDGVANNNMKSVIDGVRDRINTGARSSSRFKKKLVGELSVEIFKVLNPY